MTDWTWTVISIVAVAGVGTLVSLVWWLWRPAHRTKDWRPPTHDLGTVERFRHWRP